MVIDGEHAKRNRLAGETSPYLLEHADNPVQWYPWGDEAFARAAAEDRPVFLSIGYSACHWCHVMARESFEDGEIAELMNRAFINIKVDREERPDVDRLYMEFCQALTGSGGWPLNIVMTPDRRPFFAATYIPRESGPRGMGMRDLVPRLEEIWHGDRERVVDSAGRIVETLRAHADVPVRGAGPDPGAAVDALYRSFDAERGGFGGAPKFPMGHLLVFLSRYHHATGDERAREMAVKTLESMGRGGIRDHLGFGFHRYSTDGSWRLPHFEKMLYDQALLAMAYLEGHRAFGVDSFAGTAREIFTYVLRDLAAPSGAFYAAEDADSEGEEGRFYLWRRGEIVSLLGPDVGERFCSAYGVRDEGNVRDEATRRLTGNNVLFLEGAEDSSRFREARRILLEARGKRIRPRQDDKILTDWNGLMIAALAKGAAVLGDASLVAAASRAASHILETHRAEDGSLLHCLRGEQAPLPAMADDYAFFTWGLIELYEATFSSSYLRAAMELTEAFIASFWDDTSSSFYSTRAGETGDLLFRRRELLDGAVPSANSAAMMNLLRLGRMTGRTDLEDKARRVAGALPGELSEHLAACAWALAGILAAREAPCEIVLAGKPGSASMERLLNAARKFYLPHAVILGAGPRGSDWDLAGLAPGAEKYRDDAGDAAVHVCAGFSCKSPVSTPEEVSDLLKGLGKNKTPES